MSWFDASSFSKYAKTALKQAQKNIDKVLDISEEDSSNASKYASLNPDFPYPTELISSPKSSSSSPRSSSPQTTPTREGGETDSFFNSFLGGSSGGGDKKKKSNSSESISSAESNSQHTTISSKVSPRRGKLTDRQKELVSDDVTNNVDISSRENIDTTQRKGRLKDRTKEVSPSRGSDLLRKTSPEKKHEEEGSQNELRNGFDDIDLTESDIDLDEDDDEELISTPSTECNLLTKLHKSGDDLDCLDDIVTTPTTPAGSPQEDCPLPSAAAAAAARVDPLPESNDAKGINETDAFVNDGQSSFLATYVEETGPPEKEITTHIEVEKEKHNTVEGEKSTMESEKDTIEGKNETIKGEIDIGEGGISNMMCRSNHLSGVGDDLSDTVTSSQQQADIETNEGKVNDDEEENNSDAGKVGDDVDRSSDVADNAGDADGDAGNDESTVTTTLRTQEWIENNIQENATPPPPPPTISVEKEIEVGNDTSELVETLSTVVDDENEYAETIASSRKEDPSESCSHQTPAADTGDSNHSSFCVINEPNDDAVEKLMTLAETELWSPDSSPAEVPYKHFPQTPYCSDAMTSELAGDTSTTPDDVIQEEVELLNQRIAELNKEVVTLQNVVDARELKMVDLSKQNISYQESISVYKSQLEQLEAMTKEEDGEMEEMRQEFMVRIAEVDNKCHAAIKDRDQAKARLIEVEASLRQSTNEQVSVLTNSLLEKEETIKDLLNEGEALSKKEMESNQRIKKLRIKLKELNTTNTSQTEKISGFEKEIEKLKEAIKEKENNETKLNNELQKLEGITDSQEDEVSALKEQLDDMDEKYKAMESTLHNTYNEINRLNLENAQKQSAIQETTHAREEKRQLEERLKDVERTSKFGKEELLTQLEDLQMAYSRLEQQLGRREDELKKEIEDVHKRLEHGEHRNQELSQSVSAATKPLLRQIANLQNNFTIQSDSWERIEKSLTDRLASMQDQLALAVEKERVASEVAVETKAKLKAIQTRVTSLKDEKTNLQLALENEINKTKDHENAWKRERSTLENKLSNFKIASMELEGEKKVLKELLSTEKVKYDNETVRLNAQISLHQQRQQQQQQQQHTTTPTPASRHSRQSSTSSLTGEFDTSFHDSSSVGGGAEGIPLQRYLSSSSSFHEGFSKGGNTTTAASLEHLKSQLRSREGEVYVLQEEVRSLERTKASLAQELVSLANRIEELEESSRDVELLKQERKEMTSRYNAVLQMYGEKEEENEELKMDIADMKNMYRQQIQELCGGTR